MIVCVGNTKGGVGKTTITVNLAAMAALQGKSVFVIDSDRQQTALTALTVRNGQGTQPAIACASYVQPATLKTQLAIIKDKFDLILIDAGGRETSALRAALLLSDTLLVPFAPRSFDVWALGDIHAIIEEANSMRPEPLKCFGVLSGADSQTASDNADAIEALAEHPLITYLPAPLRKRKAVANAAALGMGVVEYKPKNETAEGEFNTLYSALFAS